MGRGVDRGQHEHRFSRKRHAHAFQPYPYGDREVAVRDDELLQSFVVNGSPGSRTLNGATHQPADVNVQPRQGL